MHTVSQSYSSQIYTQIQDSTPIPGDSIRFGNETSTESQSSGLSSNETVSLSPEGKKLSQKAPASSTDETIHDQDSTTQGMDQQNLSTEEQTLLQELKARDTEVRTHEQAHLSAAGQYAAGGASFSYKTGPDGKRYASSGEVPIDMTQEKTPEATIQKMRTVRRAALAPASPSAADRNIAAQASTKRHRRRRKCRHELKHHQKLNQTLNNPARIRNRIQFLKKTKNIQPLPKSQITVVKPWLPHIMRLQHFLLTPDQ